MRPVNLLPFALYVFFAQFSFDHVLYISFLEIQNCKSQLTIQIFRFGMVCLVWLCVCVVFFFSEFICHLSGKKLLRWVFFFLSPAKFLHTNLPKMYMWKSDLVLYFLSWYLSWTLFYLKCYVKQIKYQMHYEIFSILIQILTKAYNSNTSHVIWSWEVSTRHFLHAYLCVAMAFAGKYAVKFNEQTKYGYTQWKMVFSILCGAYTQESKFHHLFNVSAASLQYDSMWF